MAIAAATVVPGRTEIGAPFTVNVIPSGIVDFRFQNPAIQSAI